MVRQASVKVRHKLLGYNFCLSIQKSKRSHQDRLEITAQLLLHGIKTVIVLARSEDEFHTACEDWSHRDGLICGEQDARVQFVRCDLGDITNVQAAAEEIRKKTDRVHILFCNAGKIAITIYLGHFG